MVYDINIIMSQMQIGISRHLLDEHFTVLWANEYIYELTGYSKSVFRTRFHNHVDEYYREKPSVFNHLKDEIRKAYESNESGYVLECPIDIKRGKLIWVCAIGRFTTESYRGIPVIYNVFFDITLLKNKQLELEDKLRQLNGTLENVLKEKNDLSDLLISISTEIRTSVNLITGLIDIVRLNQMDQKSLAEYYDKIDDAVSTLRKIMIKISSMD